jgi:pilus assembly protein CpaC
VLAVGAVQGAEPTPHRFPVTLDRSRILETASTITKVSVTNPRIADVTVLSPTAVLVSGKSVGITSVVLFASSRVNAFEVVVRPGPVAESPSTVAPDAQVHNVIVQRADKLTDHAFVRDGQTVWVELGDVKPATEVKK